MAYKDPIQRAAYFKSRRKRQNELERNRRKKYPEKVRNSRLKCLYGISLEEYNTIFKNQNGNCAICGKNQSELKKNLVVDHSHVTNKVRGLLCDNCNRGIGCLFDNLEILAKASNYIKQYK